MKWKLNISGRQTGRFLLVIVLVLVITEIALRVFQPISFEYYRNLKELHVFHPDYLVALTPNADIYLKDNKGLWQGRFQTNSLGMRGSRELDPSQRKIACLGDSMVMGFGVSDQDAFCSIIDQNQIRGQSYQTLNLAVDAFGSRGYARRLEEIAKVIPLKAVLLFISPNDYTMPAELRDRGILSDDENDAIRFADPMYVSLFKWRFQLTRYSHFMHAILVSYQQILIRLQLIQRSWITELVHLGFIDFRNHPDVTLKHKPGFLNWIRYAFYRPPGTQLCDTHSSSQNVQANHRPSLAKQCPQPIPRRFSCQKHEVKDPGPLKDITKKYYKEIIDISKEHGIELIVVLTPIQDQTLYCTQAGQYSHSFDYALQARNYFELHSIHTIDLRPYVPAMCNTRDSAGNRLQINDYYIEGDGHFTAVGNHWAANAITRELEKLKDVF